MFRAMTDIDPIVKLSGPERRGLMAHLLKLREHFHQSRPAVAAWAHERIIELYDEGKRQEHELKLSEDDYFGELGDAGKGALAADVDWEKELEGWQFDE